MAQRLRTQGQLVALLALVEPSQPRTPGPAAYAEFAASFAHRLFRRAGHHSRGVAQRSSAERKAYLRLKLKVVGNMWASARYVPKPYAGRIDLFLTQDSLENRSARLAWRELAAAGAALHIIPGSHDTIVGDHDTSIETAHIGALAAQLKACIDAALS
jgi:thioesterase domain-containing protein